ncbi:ABC transporter ATP-binding protein [Bdellovibrio sp. HCB2-146]|uniref:ABC transporter ATP-binding protein n=1 Tax=Bdellovibrio sp. HCB2-146 TaxID=3394362 RepID=UPI0039BCC057
MSLKIEGLTKKYGDREVLKNFSLEIPSGSFTAVVGPSGCGKSTLLRLMAGLETLTSGKLSYDSNENQDLGFVFQDAQLLTWRTVSENILLPLELKKVSLSKEAAQSKVQDVLKKVKLENVADLFPHHLSGGMKMRVSLARALISNPKWLFMDEPFAALDELTRFDMQDLLKDLWLKEKITVVFVTHALTEAAYLSERIVMLSGKNGSISGDEKPPKTNLNGEDFRASTELNQFVKTLSERLRA